jgi:CRP/FNR family cyclic AMP-dependent transcriptional regulator
LTLPEWRQLAPYLSIRFLRPGDSLVREGEADRVLYILAEGELQVRIHQTVLATLQPGKVVGEGTFFSGEPRSATVVSAATAGVAWSMTWEKFEAMSQKHPRLALDLVRGLAGCAGGAHARGHPGGAVHLSLAGTMAVPDQWPA